jgi:hypothetical protein
MAWQLISVDEVEAQDELLPIDHPPRSTAGGTEGLLRILVMGNPPKNSFRSWMEIAERA